MPAVRHLCARLPYRRYRVGKLPLDDDYSGGSRGHLCGHFPRLDHLLVGRLALAVPLRIHCRTHAPGAEIGCAVGLLTPGW